MQRTRKVERRKKASSYEGLQETVRRLKTPAIETWRNQYPDRDYVITIDIPEFTCICPKTGLPDFATIVIRYIPDRLCLELKSFKYYTIFYRDVGIFNEHVINKMLDDCVKSCKPRWMEIVGEFNARGGIKTTVKAEYRA
ncbi:MAG: NADPH-dependent 7-cyano-7-deazaguanine reductase QueF [Candidatus Omnitrophica bacterium]|nr:NADPH-dependent 7-cyano-7-deazaguanine reductase QueF [Candidatus Omnitrophota bacterium]